jgi:hypothetical protein
VTTTAPENRAKEAGRLALAGLVIGLGPPLLLLAPIFYYQMEFMLYPWAWPTVCGGIGLILSGLGWRRAGGARRVRALAGVGLLVSAATTALALGGWGAMVLSMVAPAPGMPMP